MTEKERAGDRLTRAQQVLGALESWTCDDPLSPFVGETLVSLSAAKEVLSLALAEATPHLSSVCEFLDVLDDRSLDDLKEARRQGTYHGDIYDAPDDCETLVPITRGELRKIRGLFREGVRAEAAPAPQLKEQEDHSRVDGECLSDRQDLPRPAKGDK